MDLSRELQSSSDLTVTRSKSGVSRSGLVLSPGSTNPGIPEFVPARGLSGANLQTVFASLFPGRTTLPGTVQRHLRLDDGDLIVLHDNTPPTWERGDHVVLLLHGLGGSHQSGYMVRMAAKLSFQGIRVIRMDHRGCGAGVHAIAMLRCSARSSGVAMSSCVIQRSNVW